MIFNRNNIMKRIIYIFTLVAALALCSCAGQYDNIDKFTTEETIYVGKYTDAPYIRIGYQRVEIELLGLEVGRISPDNIYLGKAKKTVIEYEEGDVMFRQTIDSVCSWVNITGLTTPKTYIFKIYAEDANGNRSVPVEVLGKPFTDADLAGLPFPTPYIIPTPSSIDFRWIDDSELSTALFRYAGLSYSYTTHNGPYSGTLRARETPRFEITGLYINETVKVNVSCRIIPMLNSKQIIDTVTMHKDFTITTVTKEEYLATRPLLPITSAMIDPDDPTKGKIKYGVGSNVDTYLEWSQIRYYNTSGEWVVSKMISNNDPADSIECYNIAHGVKIQVNCAYTAERLETGWRDVVPFMSEIKDRKNWVVLPRNGYHPWDDTHGSEDSNGINWPAGYPMRILDNDYGGGWHSSIAAGVSFPQILIIDMKESKKVAKVELYGGNPANTPYDGYWNNVSVYVTSSLPMSGYVSHTINWDDVDKQEQIKAYDRWLNAMVPLVPAGPLQSWGAPVRAVSSRGPDLSFPMPQTKTGQYLIVMFPDNIRPDDTWIFVRILKVYTDE
jgi:hypothetical protein